MENSINSLSNLDLLLKLYVYVDDEVQTVEPILEAKMLPRDRRGRKAKLSEAEILTILLFGMVRGYRDKQKLYNAIWNYHRREFPNLPVYSKFVAASNRVLIVLGALLERWLAFNRQHQEEKPIPLADSSAMPVCKNARGTSHKVFKQWARWSKTTPGWFYGSKLHLECDRDGHLTRGALTMGNCDDRKLVDFFTDWMRGGTFIADAGYVDQKRGEKLAREQGIYYLTGVRKNMEKMATFAQLFLLRLRQMVETVFSVLKERLLLIRSTHRSVVAGFSHFVTCLLGYCLKKAAF